MQRKRKNTGDVDVIETADTAVATSRDGTTITYDVRGPTLIYVTGASCFRTFAPVVKDATAFASDFTVVTYDRRGRGESTDNGQWSLDREIDDLEALIERVGGAAYVYGHSSGAVLALHAALRMPEKIRGVVLYDASWVGSEQERTEYAQLRNDVEIRLDAGRHAGAMRRFLSGIGMPRVFVALLPLMPGWQKMVAVAPTLRYDMALTADLPPYGAAAAVRVPTHIVVGEDSPQGLHTVARGLADAVPGATQHVLPGQDHMVSATTLLPILRDRLPADAG